MTAARRAGEGVGGSAVYRAPMRSRDDGVREGLAVDRALQIGVCGMGGRLDRIPGSPIDALAAADAAYGERTARRLERFVFAPEGSFVWTRDVDGLLWLGRITGPWRYDGSGEARDVDLVHVRTCEWLDRPVEPATVPSGVHEAFARGGRNWQSITRADAARLTAAVWEERRAG